MTKFGKDDQLQLSKPIQHSDSYVDAPRKVKRQTNSNRTRRINGFYLTGTQDIWFPPRLQALYNSGNISETFEMLANSMSLAIRQGDDNNSQVPGEASELVVIYRVVWYWIIPHTMLLLAAAILLSSTMYQQSAE